MENLLLSKDGLDKLYKNCGKPRDIRRAQEN